jgi:hypothetical protein
MFKHFPTFRTLPWELGSKFAKSTYMTTPPTLKKYVKNQFGYIKTQNMMLVSNRLKKS